MDEAFLSKKYNFFNTVYIVYDLSYRTIWEVGGLSDHMRTFFFNTDNTDYTWVVNQYKSVYMDV